MRSYGLFYNIFIMYRFIIKIGIEIELEIEVEIEFQNVVNHAYII